MVFAVQTGDFGCTVEEPWALWLLSWLSVGWAAGPEPGSCFPSKHLVKSKCSKGVCWSYGIDIFSKGKSQVGKFPALIGVFPSRTRLLAFPVGSYGSSISGSEWIVKIKRDKVFAYVLHSTYPTLFFLDCDEQHLFIQVKNLLKLTFCRNVYGCRSNSLLH